MTGPGRRGPVDRIIHRRDAENAENKKFQVKNTIAANGYHEIQQALFVITCTRLSSEYLFYFYISVFSASLR
jgi:hypothetical protein